MKIGIYPGSFDPPHKGHLKVVNYLLNNNIIDKIIIVPTPNYWEKNNLSSIDDRINMLKFYENNRIKVEDVYNNYQYTIDLMNNYKKIYFKDSLYLIIGADNLINFNKWKDYDKLLQYNIIVMARNKINFKNELIKNKNITFIEDFPYIDISSSEIRNNLSSKYLDKDVLNYIVKKGLY